MAVHDDEERSPRRPRIDYSTLENLSSNEYIAHNGKYYYNVSLPRPRQNARRCFIETTPPHLDILILFLFIAQSLGILWKESFRIQIYRSSFKSEFFRDWPSDLLLKKIFSKFKQSYTKTHDFLSSQWLS